MAALNAEKMRKIQIERAEKFMARDGHWFDINLHSKLYSAKAKSAVALSVWSVPGPAQPTRTDRITFTEASKQVYTPTTVGERAFGPSWTTHWFKVHIKVPVEWQGEQVNFLWDSEGEALLWKDNEPLQAFLGSDGDDRRADFVLTHSAQGGEEFDFFLEMAVNGMFGLGAPSFLSPPPADKTMKVRIAEIGVVDKAARSLYFDLDIILGMAKEMDENDTRAWQAVEAVRQIVNTVHTDDPSSFAPAAAIAKKFLAQKNGERAHEISAIGHCHIDTAWLWPYSETRRKVARSWATQCTLMADYPDYKFAASQAQQYEWMKELYPKLYEKMKHYISKGQFVPIGGSWVEMDCNIPSGESFVRQFLFGQRFFQQEFGKTCEVFWLPDTFGYSCQLPQIVRECGIKYFLTQKLSWNNINKFPHNTFIWEGLDGSKVPSHFPPADTYVSYANVKDAVYGAKNFKTKDKSNSSMMVFGYGDGGGGPDRAMLERLDRLKDVDGVPRIQQRHPTDHFAQMLANSPDLPLWIGELYFELHRGTYTTQAKNKLGNRKSEFFLQRLEFLASVAQQLKIADYPSQDLAHLWKIVLLNQFHDVLPGTSIGLVYKDTDELYAEVEQKATKLIAELSQKLLGPEDPSATAVALVNTLGWARKAVVELPIATTDNAQVSAGGKVLGVVSAESYAITPKASVDLTGSKELKITKSGDGVELSNSFITAKLNNKAELVSLFHKKTGRESIAEGQVGNKFVLFEDIPFYWDAWDVEIYHTEKPCKVDGTSSFEVTESGPVRAAAKFSFKVSALSSLVQIVSLDAISEILAFDTTVEWHENRKFLKVEFPLNVYATNAAYSTHMGWLYRPTHRNTTWDMAKFEVCGHHWADLSEFGFGVAILNDCKYGYSALGSVLTLSLLRAAKMPDADADMGTHHFKYGVLAHSGSHVDANLQKVGYEFNQPLQISPSTKGVDKLANVHSFFQVNQPNVILETIKKAEEGNNTVVRLWESLGGRGSVKIQSALKVAKVVVTDALEVAKSSQALVELAQDGQSFTVAFKPFEILTLSLTFA